MLSNESTTNPSAYQTLHVRIEGGVAQVTLSNPPVNVLSATMITELSALLSATASDPGVKVIVFESANPEFFIAHVDMTLDLETVETLARQAPPGLNPFQALNEALRHQPQLTIVKLAGLARGGGAELVEAADLSFAAIGRAGLSHCEALMGIIPGGGATQYLSSRMGRSHALEVILGADLFDAQTAERYGWINRALPADELDAFVMDLARHIASLPAGVIAAAKRAMLVTDFMEGLRRESDEWLQLVTQPTAGRLIGGGVAKGLQTPAGERQLETILRSQLS